MMPAADPYMHAAVQARGKEVPDEILLTGLSR
jgi:hypothetical protein